jgi:hypothetical protein
MHKLPTINLYSLLAIQMENVRCRISESGSMHKNIIIQYTSMLQNIDKWAICSILYLKVMKKMSIYTFVGPVFSFAR